MKPQCRQIASRGIALLMVLASLALLSSVVVEFAYNSNVTYNLAMNEKERTQAYYLAQSGLAFTKLLLKYDREARRLASQASSRLGRNFQIEPLYVMIPISSEVLRGMASMTAPPEGGAGEGEEAPPPDEKTEALSAFNIQDSEFLKFEGDFSSEVIEENAKINVNAFLSMAPTDPGYDRLKSVLYHLLLTDEFKGMFEDRYRGAKELVQNIADYIDRDDAQNEVGGQERGREGVGAAAGQIKMKNGKLISLDELMLVPGMTEDIFQKLKNYVTIYGIDPKIYACRAQEPVIKSLILAYTEANPDRMEPLKDENTDLLTRAYDAVLNSCPDLQAMADELDRALGATTPGAGGGTTPGATPGPTSSLTGSTTNRGTTGAAAGAITNTFNSMLREDNTMFSVIGIGTVGETQVKIKVVLDTANNNASRWQTLYWRVE
jgi:type II secretory pathway component PulK